MLLASAPRGGTAGGNGGKGYGAMAEFALGGGWSARGPDEEAWRGEGRQGDAASGVW
jgi:hypothetical protein